MNKMMHDFATVLKWVLTESLAVLRKKGFYLILVFLFFFVFLYFIKGWFDYLLSSSDAYYPPSSPFATVPIKGKIGFTIGNGLHFFAFSDFSIVPAVGVMLLLPIWIVACIRRKKEWPAGKTVLLFLCLAAISVFGVFFNEKLGLEFFTNHNYASAFNLLLGLFPFLGLVGFTLLTSLIILLAKRTNETGRITLSDFSEVFDDVFFRLSDSVRLYKLFALLMLIGICWEIGFTGLAVSLREHFDSTGSMAYLVYIEAAFYWLLSIVFLYSPILILFEGKGVFDSIRGSVQFLKKTWLLVFMLSILIVVFANITLLIDVFVFRGMPVLKQLIGLTCWAVIDFVLCCVLIKNYECTPIRTECEEAMLKPAEEAEETRWKTGKAQKTRTALGWIL